MGNREVGAILARVGDIWAGLKKIWGWGMKVSGGPVALRQRVLGMLRSR